MRMNKYLFIGLVGMLLASLGFLAGFHYWLEPQYEKVMAELNKEISSQKKTSQKWEHLYQQKIAENSGDKEGKKEQLIPKKKIEPVNELASQMEKVLKSNQFVGTAIFFQNNQPLLAKSYGQANQRLNLSNQLDTPYFVGSVQKGMTGVLVMKLIENGQLSFDTPLNKFYPEVPNSDTITIRSLLDMTSGLTLKETSQSFATEKEYLAYALKHVTYEPLEKWKYESVNYTLLASIIEKVTGKSYQAYFREVLIEPLQLFQTGFYTDLKQEELVTQGYLLGENHVAKQVPFKPSTFTKEMGTGDIYMTVSDLLRFYQGLASGKVLTPLSLSLLREKTTKPYTYYYQGGMYVSGDTLYSHGVISGFETSVRLNKDVSKGVILITNERNPKNSIHRYSKDLYNMLSQK